MVFRRDRIACTRGADNLEAMRLTDATKTRRMIASCCKRRCMWPSTTSGPGCRRSAPLSGLMRRRWKCGSARGSDGRKTRPNDGLPSHPAYPPAMIVRILAAWPLMLFSRRVGALP